MMFVLALCVAVSMFMHPCNSFRPALQQVQRATRKSLYALHMGIFDTLKNIVKEPAKQSATSSSGAWKVDNDNQLLRYKQRVQRINSLESSFEDLSDQQLQSKTAYFRQQLASGKSIDSLLEEAFAVVREASFRVLELSHYDVQLMGGMALFEGFLAEMATGEGKTLVALLPLYLTALQGESAVVVTANDYLARRDGDSMGQVLRFLGLSVGVVQSEQPEPVRRAAYDSDVVYVANQAIGFDYLRDNLALAKESLVMSRPFGFCLVDEADSILIDEARTPLVISRRASAASFKYAAAARIVEKMIANRHYEVDVKNQKVELLLEGYRLAEQLLGKATIFDPSDPWAYFLLNAVRAKELLSRDKQYIVTAEGRVALVDAFSGRVLEGRQLAEGLQQAVEAKEGLAITSESQNVAKISFQSLFRLFPRLAGMTGTAGDDAEEFYETYGLKVIKIPTALPIARRDNPDAVFRTKDGRLKAMLKNVLGNHEKGRPLLIGTTSIESSEEIASAMSDLGLSTRLLNAKPENTERENEIVAQAGRVGAITIATNMAGRGTDIALGGSPSASARFVLKYLLLLRLDIYRLKDKLVIADEEGDGKESNNGDLIAAVAMDRDFDLPILPSDSCRREVYAAVETISQALQQSVASQTPASSRQQLGLLVQEIVAEAVDGFSFAGSSCSAALTPAAFEQLRTAATSLKKEFKVVTDRERDQVLRLGGLYVVGTARHESRRIDNQLRGRAGRQGDPGSSRFFLSLEDDLFRIFGGNKLSGVMENFRVPEDVPIESPLVTQALDGVQAQVEETNRATRKQLQRLDEVAAVQRQQLYSRRRGILDSSDTDLLAMLEQDTEATAKEIFAASEIAPSKINTEKLSQKLLQFFPNIDINAAITKDVNNMKSSVLSATAAALKEKEKEISGGGSWTVPSFIRYMTLVQIDEAWCRHLTRLDLMKEEMVLQSFTAERDVFEVYRERADKLYSAFFDDVRRNTVYSIFIFKGSKKQQ